MTYQYEAALSFAGEDRAFAEAVATGLRDAGIQVFYDNFYESDLWGEDLSVKLRNVYYADSRYCMMILSNHYVEKMWTNFERQQAIERLIQEKGGSYVLPVRLDGFRGDVQGLSNLLGYLSAGSSEPQKVVENFLQKIGKPSSKKFASPLGSPASTHIPNLKKPFSDRERNQFIREAFDEVVSSIERFANATRAEHPHFDYDMERITSRKVLFTFYSSDEELTGIKIWFGGSAFGRQNAICISHGKHIDADHDNSMNESLSVEEHEGQLVLKPLGMAMFGHNRDSYMTPQEGAGYIWQIACRTFT